MALTAGTRLGPYAITAQIGVGGMGEVYRATDTTLNRQGAVKVLPESLASDAERIARFEREAKTLASLNHTNIAHKHDPHRRCQTSLASRHVPIAVSSDAAARDYRSECLPARCSVIQCWLTSPRSSSAPPRRRRKRVTANPTPAIPTSDAMMIQLVTGGRVLESGSLGHSHKPA